MFKTLDRKLVAVLVCFALAMAAMFLFVMRELDMARNQELSQKLYRSLANQLVAEHVVSDEDSLDASRMQGVFDRLRVINPRIDVYLLAGDGKILASSVRTRVLREHVDLAPVKRFFDDSAELPILGDDPTETSRQRVFSAAPIQSPDGRRQYLYLVMRGLTSDSIADRIKSNHVIRKSLWVILWGVLFALIAAAIILRFITRPLRDLTEVMDKFEQSGLALPQGTAQLAPGKDRPDEIRQITSTFHTMADRIIEQMRALQRNDAMRRELIANVSHDLRTPLASVRGYLETLHVKAATLSEQERRNYTEIALKQSSALGHLVNELFELAKLDGDQPALLTEPFVLEDLVHDVLQQFELSARERQINLTAVAPDELPLVVADIGMIERVLRNLIDNALRHTPDGGNVTITLAADANGVTLEVADTGCGIAHKDLPRIFERFYRSDRSRGGEHNAGLGLAICKRILELHGTAISVSSRPGATVFGFALPCNTPVTA